MGKADGPSRGLHRAAFKMPFVTILVVSHCCVPHLVPLAVALGCCCQFTCGICCAHHMLSHRHRATCKTCLAVMSLTLTPSLSVSLIEAFSCIMAEALPEDGPCLSSHTLLVLQSRMQDRRNGQHVAAHVGGSQGGFSRLWYAAFDISYSQALAKHKEAPTCKHEGAAGAVLKRDQVSALQSQQTSEVFLGSSTLSMHSGTAELIAGEKRLKCSGVGLISRTDLSTAFCSA